MKVFLFLATVLIMLAQAERNRPSNKSKGTLNKKYHDRTLSPSLQQDSFIPIDKNGQFSITSMTVQHRSDARWYVPHYHKKYSAGWNRTVASGTMSRPIACNIRFFATALESTLKNYLRGGTGYVTLQFKKKNVDKVFYHGFDKNETGKLHCYYITNKGYGSEFVDSPKTLSIAVYCPVSLDFEIGEYKYSNAMSEGSFCRVLADYETTIMLHLRESTFPVPLDYAKYDMSEKTEIVSEGKSNPTGARLLKVTDFTDEDRLSQSQFRPHAVCTVQTFRNAQTGPMLYLFVSYYHRLGWRVIVYDRFGNHKEFIEDLLHLPGFDYHPYTIFQLTNPTKYNDKLAKNQNFGYKVYYNMEINWGFGKTTNGTLTDTADQDADKARTYDHNRIEYAHLDTIMYIDSDEMLHCPQGGNNAKSQRKYQQHMMNGFVLKGIEEMRMVRLPYSGLAPTGFNDTVEQRGSVDFTLHTTACMQGAYQDRNVTQMLGCWSQASSYDDFPKSADMGGVCPFHYNHWSCDGMKGGGRDHAGAERCRCKVAFDLVNFLAYKPVIERCHLIHFNNNKYRFQLRRIEHSRLLYKNKRIKQGKPPAPEGPIMSQGDVTVRSPMYQIFKHSNQLL